MITEHYTIETKVLHHLVCKHCTGLLSVPDGKFTDELIKDAERHIKNCWYNPANGYCETCAHAQIMQLDLHCNYTDELMSRSQAPHPCEGYKEKGDEV